MIYLITPENYKCYRTELDNMYRLRHKVFFEQLKWQVNSNDGMEKDEFDEKNAHYLIYKDEKGIIRGCQRLIEMKNPCMFDGPFKFFLSDLSDFKRPGYWEASRFAIDHEFDENYTSKKAQEVCLWLLAASVYFGLEIQPMEFCLSISMPSVKKLYSHYGFIGATLAERKINNDVVVVNGYKPLTYTYDAIMKRLTPDLKSPVLYYTGPMYDLSYQKSQAAAKSIFNSHSLLPVS